MVFPVTVKKFSEMSGYSVKAIYHKIERGIWKEGIHWNRAPDGRLIIDPLTVSAWMRGEAA